MFDNFYFKDVICFVSEVLGHRVPYSTLPVFTSNYLRLVTMEILTPHSVLYLHLRSIVSLSDFLIITSRPLLLQQKNV